MWGRVLGQASVAALLLVAPVWAQTTAPLPADVAGRRYDFDQPAQPLGQALAAFSRITGLQTSVPTGQLAGRQAGAVRGSLTAEDALRQMLAGSGMTWRFAGQNTVTLIETPQTGGTTQLDPVTVEGRSGIGGSIIEAQAPVPGFVATRSAAGTKTDTPILETPQSISVIGRNEIEARQAQSVAQALDYTPGVRTLSGDSRYDWITIRGFDPAVYYDNLFLYTGNFGYADLRLEPYGLERIEVLKGPASALYGRGQPGGVLNLVAKHPTANPFGEVTLQAGSFQRGQGTFDVGGPLDANGQFLWRLTGLARNSNTQTQYVPDDRVFIAPAFTWRPDNDTTLTFLGQYQKDDSGAAGIFFPSSGTVLPNPNGKLPNYRYLGEPGYDRIQRWQYLAGYEFEHRLNETWTLRQNLRYNQGHNGTDVVRNHPQMTTASAFGPDGRTLTRATIRFRQTTGTLALDNQAQATFSTGPVRHTALFGVDYTHIQDDFQRGVGAAPTINAFNPVYGATIITPRISYQTAQRQNAAGLYVQDQLSLDRFRLTLSGRQDWSSIKTSTISSGTSVTNRDNAFTGRAGLGYLFDMGLMPYASYATSFMPTIGTDSTGRPLKPTTGRQYEIGAKYQPAGFSSFVTVSAFDLTKRNVLGTSGLTIFQTGEVQVRGIELEGKASLADGFDIVASYSYQNPKVTQDANPIYVGKRPVSATGMPRHTGAVWADYTLQRTALAGVGLGAGIRYVGSTYGDRTNSYEVPSYTLLDASIRYDLGNASPRLAGFDVALNATNLLDKNYVVSCINPNECYLGTGRTVLATMRYRW